MSKKGSHNRREKERNLRPPLTRNAISPADRPETERIVRQERKSLIRKRLLILCEGETEQAYFEGITNNPLVKNMLTGVNVQVLAPTHNAELFDPERHLMDNSLQGLVWEAIQRKKAAQRAGNPYDDIWVVIDADDNRGHIFRKYTDNSPEAPFFENGEFVYGQSRPDASQRPKQQNFDANWKQYVKMAYSCRSFEVWLLLHFEQNSSPHLSEEDSKAKIRMHSPAFEKGIINSVRDSRANAYEMLKPAPLFNLKYETEADAQAVLDKIEIACENAVWLCNHQTAAINDNGGLFWGVNPYTSVDKLISVLLDKNETIILSELNQRVLVEEGRFEVQFDENLYQFTLLVEISPGQRFFLNSFNVSDQIWIQIKADHHIEKVIPTGLASPTLSLPDFTGGTIGEVIVQFPVLRLQQNSLSLHFKYAGKRIIFKIL